jgi:beta-lactamase regulating signal transducer with metallopeptidase domain
VLISGCITFIALYDTAPTRLASEISSLTVENRSLGFESTSTGGISLWKYHLQEYLPFIVSVWILGILVFFLRIIAGVTYLRQLKISSNPIEERWNEKLKELKSKVRLNKVVEFAESGLIQIPIVVGHIKPYILFPIGAINLLSIEEVEAILAHELAHIKRNDFIHNFLQSLIEVIFYYHPAVWWISAVVRSERENCCDDMAVALCGNSLTYAKTLLRLQSIQHAPALALPLVSSKSVLISRIKRILNQPQNKSQTMEKSIATFFLVICMMLFSISATSPDDAPDFDVQTDLVFESTFTVENAPGNTTLHIDFRNDSIPPRTKTKIRKRTENEDIEIVLRGDKIESLKINGELIPESQYDEHKEIIEELSSESAMNIPPLPPPPPMPDLPDIPAPPHIPDTPDMPDAPASLEDPPLPPAPPAPPPPRIVKEKRKIIQKKDDTGSTIIRIESSGFENETEIEIEKEIIIIDGETIDGDTVIIIEEKILPGTGHHGFIMKSPEIIYGPDDHFFNISGDSLHYRWEFDFDADDIGDNEFMEKLKGYHFNLQDDGNFFIHLDSIDESVILRYDDLGHYGKAWKEYAKDLKDMNKQWKNDHAEKWLDYSRELLKEGKYTWEYDQEDTHFFDPERYEIRKFNRPEDHISRFFIEKWSNQAIIEALIEDGFIEEGESVNLLITDKKMKVNGKKVDEKYLKKYKQFFSGASGKPFNENSRIEIRI